MIQIDDSRDTYQCVYAVLLIASGETPGEARRDTCVSRFERSASPSVESPLESKIAKTNGARVDPRKRDPAYLGGQRFLASGPKPFPIGAWHRWSEQLVLGPIAVEQFRKRGHIDYNWKIEVHSSLLNVVLHGSPSEFPASLNLSKED